MTSCSSTFYDVLFGAYVVSLVAALANPANIDYTDAYLMAQAANVATLLIMAYCRSSSNMLAIAAGLGTALILRATGLWKGGTRWDSLMVTVGLLLNLQKLFKYALPSSIPHKSVLYLCFSCLMMPVLAATPHILHLPDVDDDTMRTAFRLSGQAYGITANASDRLGGPMWTLYDQTTDTKAGLSRVETNDKTDLYVYFSGSESEANWKTNINVLVDQVPKDWCGISGMRTHKGFQRAFASVASQMLSALQAVLNASTGERVIFVGHSLGGALATLAALYVACKLPDLRDRLVVVTFGAPQVGDGEFVKVFNQLVPRCARVVNPIDPIPRVLDVQLVQVKGYCPVGALSIDTITKSHGLATYGACLTHGKTLRTILAFWPAVAAAMVIFLYIMWKLRH